MIRDRQTDGQTDRQTDGRPGKNNMSPNPSGETNNMSPNPSGGDIMKNLISFT